MSSCLDRFLFWDIIAFFQSFKLCCGLFSILINIFVWRKRFVLL